MDQGYNESMSSVDTSSSDSDSFNTSLQSKYAKLASFNSRIPVKTRQFSAPIHPLDEQLYGLKFKPSAIPRITSSPSVPQHLLASPFRTSNHVPNKRRKSLSPIDNTLGASTTCYTKNNMNPDTLKTSVPPLRTLSRQIAGLTLDPLDSAIKSSTPLHSPKLRSSKSSKSDNKSVTKLKALPPRSISQSNANNRNSTLPKKPRVASNKSPSKTTPTITGSSTKRAVSTSTAKRLKNISNDDSPLIERLTRSTTAFNLKSTTNTMGSHRDSSESPVKPKLKAAHIIPRAQKRIVSEADKASSTSTLSSFTKPTRSSQLRHESSIANLKEKLKSTVNHASAVTLDMPKNRTIKKSYTVTNGISNFTSYMPVPSTAGKLSLPKATSSRRVPSSLGSNTSPHSLKSKPSRLKTADELFSALKMHPKTKTLLDSWNSESNFDHSKVRTCDEVRHDPSIDLNVFEKTEVMKFPHVYYVISSRTRTTSDYSRNFGLDDKDKNLIIDVKDHINYRYEVTAKLGKGMFGNVLKCADHKLEKPVGIKIMKNDVNWSLQSINEIKILKKLQKHDHVLEYYEHFNFRSHICISTELLAVNLLELLESVNYRGFHIDVIKLWSRQLLSALDYIHSHDIIHADLKPENIMLIKPNSFDLKIIDFGSSCQIHEVIYPYIQSRFYRAPEVLLGCRYDTKIDIWSFMALIYEMYFGEPLFPAKNELQLFQSIVKLIGQPSCRTILDFRDDLYQHGSINKNESSGFLDKNAPIFSNFDSLGRLKAYESPSSTFSGQSQLLKKLGVDNQEFFSFIHSGLVWNYKTRPSAANLLKHKFVNTK